MARNIKDIVTGAMRSVFGSRAPAETKTNAVDVTLAAQVKPEELHGLAELVAGMLCDPMTEICMSLKTGNLKRADVTFKVESGDEARDEVVAEDLQRLWLDTLEKLCDIRNGVLTWGGLPFERVEENLIVDGIPLTRIQQFKQLPKLVNGKKATERIVAPDGSFGGIHITIGQEDSILPPERSAWFAIGATPLDPHGKSVFIGAPEKVLEQRRKANKEFDTFVSRWAVSQMVVHAPLWGIGPNNERVNNHDRIAEKFLEKLKSGGVLILDNEAAGPNMEGKYAVDITHEPQTLDAQPMEITDKMIDSRMCMAFGIHPSVVMDTETGSYAAATVRKTIVDIQSDSEVSQLTTQFREAVADWYVARNYPEGTDVKVTISPVSLVTDGYMAEIAKTLVTGATLNPLVSSGAIDLDRMLANVGFPMEEDAEEILDALYEPGTQPAADTMAFDPAVAPEDDGGDPLFQSLDDGPEYALAIKKKPAKPIAKPAHAEKPKPPVTPPRATPASDPNAPPTGGRGSNQYAKKGVSKGKLKPVDKPKKPRTPEPVLSARSKSDIAKASAVRVDAPMQRYAENVNEAALGAAVKGASLKDNQPVDVVTFADGWKPPGPMSNQEFEAAISAHGLGHCIEMKTKLVGHKDKVEMSRGSLKKKRKFVRDYKTQIHTVAFDDRKVFNAGGEGEHDISQRKMYYRRGFGGFNYSQMYEFKTTAELNKLLAMPTRQLPKGAK